MSVRGTGIPLCLLAERETQTGLLSSTRVRTILRSNIRPGSTYSSVCVWVRGGGECNQFIALT